jgi:hypothetical protein
MDQIDMSSTTIENKTTELKKNIFIFELLLRGWKRTGGMDSYIDTGMDVVGEEIIQKLVGLLQPFCEESNLITSKQFETFSKQKWEINTTMNETLLNNIGCPADKQKFVIKMFKSTFQNVNDVTLSSKGLIRDMFRLNNSDTRGDLNV